MNWFEYTEQKRKLLIGGTVVICLAMLLVTARRNIFSYDGYWHLKAGLDWLDHGLSLWLDHYSFTFNGEEISSPPYIFQVSLGWLVNRFGLEPGFQIYRIANFLFLFGLFLAFLRRLRVPALVYCLVLPMVVVLFQLRTLTPPELVSYSLMVLAMMLYYRARNQLSAAAVLPMIGLMLLWSNHHTPIFGYRAAQRIGKLVVQGFSRPGAGQGPNWRVEIGRAMAQCGYTNQPAVHELL